MDSKKDGISSLKSGEDLKALVDIRISVACEEGKKNGFKIIYRLDDAITAAKATAAANWGADDAVFCAV